MHSAAWDHDYDFAGKKVGVIGTGASAVQIVPELVEKAAASRCSSARRVGAATVQPRGRRDDESPVPHGAGTAVPRPCGVVRHTSRWPSGSCGSPPATRVVEAVSKLNMRLQVRDPWMRRQLTPDFRAGCKRLLMTSKVLPALQADNCRLITWPIARICEKGVRTVEGIEHRFDCLVFATGFEVSKQGSSLPITGRGGRVLNEEWRRGAYAYKSFAVSGYPNLYITFGPNSVRTQLCTGVHGGADRRDRHRVRTILDRDLACST